MFDQKAILASLAIRAKACDVKPYLVCEKAGLAPSTYYRWKRGAKATLDSIAAFDRALSKIEKEKAA